MKAFSLGLTALILMVSLGLMSYTLDGASKEAILKTVVMQDSVLRHVVLFKFKDGTSGEKLAEIEKAFTALPTKIPQIQGYEWGLNNSPEGLEKGFTHCFFLTFKSEADRAIYLPHPDHRAFGALLKPHLEDVLVVDYWTH
ncbi:Dabb family protein [Flavobacteriaceae bacterium 3-367]|uniref:Dabb family protein n=1 Tax=Eudoraea algarum TaxID=3417568 RepID=UPI00328F2CE6